MTLFSHVDPYIPNFNICDIHIKLFSCVDFCRVILLLTTVLKNKKVKYLNAITALNVFSLTATD